MSVLRHLAAFFGVAFNQAIIAPSDRRAQDCIAKLDSVINDRLDHNSMASALGDISDRLRG